MANGSDSIAILVVDDDISTLVTLSEFLQDRYQLYVVQSGEQALLLTQGETRPDLILLDVNMPGMNGYDVLTRLKLNENTADIPVIIVTGQGYDEDYTRGFDLGAVDYIVKPISKAILLARIRTHISLARKTKILEAQATTDPLTKIANRRRYDEVKNIEWNRLASQVQPLSLVLLDIDNFKSYNDNYGHSCGDKVLIQFAQILKGCCQRTVDVAARVGGEEFAILLPGTQLQGACEVVGLIRDKLMKAAIPHAYSDAAPVVTFSAGVVTVTPKQGNNFDEMYRLADKALYDAKNSGRNTIVTATANQKN